MEVRARVQAVLSRIENALEVSGRRQDEITLVAVTKKKEPDLIEEVISILKEYGISPVLGENYVQEYRNKKDLLKEYPCHLIGHLQSNKAKDAAALFSMIQTVDSLALAKALHKEVSKKKGALPYLVQVNVSNDGPKSGVAPDEVAGLIEEIFRACPTLLFSGVMTITALYEDREQVRSDFSKMKITAGSLQQLESVHAALQGRLFEISMGMSADFDMALEEGATIIRLGSALLESGSKEQFF